MYHKYLTKEQVLKIHEIVLKSGGISGLLAEGMLELAIETPQTILFGTELHESLNHKAAAIMHEIVKLTPFVDGNKRTGFLAADTFLRENGYELRPSVQDAIEICIGTSQCSIDLAGVTHWIEANARRHHLQ